MLSVLCLLFIVCLVLFDVVCFSMYVDCFPLLFVLGCCLLMLLLIVRSLSFVVVG